MYHVGNLSNWITLAAACHVAEKDRKDTGWMFSFVKKLGMYFLSLSFVKITITNFANV